MEIVTLINQPSQPPNAKYDTKYDTKYDSLWAYRRSSTA